MDLTTVGAIGASALAVRPVVEDFLKRIFGPAADEFGAWARDKVHNFRVNNSVTIATAAEAMVREAGKEAQEIPLRTLLPLMEGASREDEPSLRQRWAALLANAATSASVSPLFPILLGQLSPLDATVLQAVERLQTAALEAASPSLKEPPPWGAKRPELVTSLSVLDNELEVSIDTLVALGLLQREPDVRTDRLQNAFITLGNELRVSALGSRFLLACRPPTSVARDRTT